MKSKKKFRQGLSFPLWVDRYLFFIHLPKSMILAVHKKIGCNEVNFRKNLYDFPMVRQSLNLANIVKMNQQEFTEIVEMFSLPKNHKKGLDSLIKKFQLKICILTLGDKGAIMATKKEYSCIVPIKTIKVLSTVGAGDSFTAAAIMGWLNKKPLDQINQEASHLAAYVCGQLEAVPSIIH